MNTLAFSLKHYLKLRRSLGYKLRETGDLLHQFVLFSKKHHASFVTTKLAVRWANMAVDCHPARKTALLSIVRQFAQYLNASDPRTEIPPKGIFTERYRRTHPHLYRDEEVFNLIESANQIPSPKGLRGPTVATLIGLLAVTGMRIGEVVGLDRTDVDLKQGHITVRRA